NGHFLCTHRQRLSRGFPPGASLRCFRLYQTFSRSDFLDAFQVPASAFPFPAIRLYQKFRAGLTGHPFPKPSEGGFFEINVSRS
ncbi:hypothetical protein, partial [Streptomyces sp. TRM68367]|uniref:hypothetical protein n=1 Tax=Streptomyces sp. TRM68367 TaxID=2758415 RepID=UPI001CA96E25